MLSERNYAFKIKLTKLSWEKRFCKWRLDPNLVFSKTRLDPNPSKNQTDHHPWIVDITGCMISLNNISFLLRLGPVYKALRWLHVFDWRRASWSSAQYWWGSSRCWSGEPGPVHGHGVRSVAHGYQSAVEERVGRPSAPGFMTSSQTSPARVHVQRGSSWILSWKGNMKI